MSLSSLQSKVVGKVQSKPREAVLIAAGGVALLVWALWRERSKLRACRGGGKSTMNPGLAKYNNLNLGGMNPIWQRGGASASDDNSATVGYIPESRTDAYTSLVRKSARPGVRQVMAKRAARRAMMARLSGRREGMRSLKCDDGEVQFIGADGVSVMCGTPDEAAAAAQAAAAAGAAIVDDGSDDDIDTAADCGQAWDPSAVADVMALNGLGAIESDSPGERRLQQAIVGEDTLSDTQLSHLMHSGSGMP